MCVHKMRKTKEEIKPISVEPPHKSKSKDLCLLGRFLNKEFTLPEDFDSPSACKCSFFGEILQSELTLWTMVCTALWTYLWQARKRYAIFNLTILLPCSLFLTSCLSGALLLIILVGRLFFSRSDRDFSNIDFNTEVIPLEIPEDADRLDRADSIAPALPKTVSESSVGHSPQSPRRSLKRQTKRSKKERSAFSNRSTTVLAGLKAPPVPEESVSSCVAYFWQRRGSRERKIMPLWNNNRNSVRSRA